MPPDSEERIALSMTVLLAFSVILFVVNQLTPASSDSTPVIGIYCTCVCSVKLPAACRVCETVRRPSVCLSVCLPVSMSVCLFVSLSVSLSPHLSLSICQSVCQSVSLSACLSPRLSVCLSVPSFARRCGGFAAERRAGRRYRSTAASAQQQRRHSTALSSKCGQCHVDNRGMMLDTDLSISPVNRH